MLYRNGEVISNNTDEEIYQQFDRHTEYHTSTITFANPLESDKGNYHCMLSKDQEIFNNFTAELRSELALVLFLTVYIYFKHKFSLS